MSQIKIQHLVLVGCGAMGGALMRGWINTSGLFDRATIVTPEEDTVADFVKDPRVSVVDPKDFSLEGADLVVFAVKPQILSSVLPHYRVEAGGTVPLYCSIAAGVPVTTYRESLGESVPFVRCMPNLPAAVEQGMSALFGDHITQDQKTVAQDLFEAVGDVAWLEDEQDFHAVTALSGSGPAYFFYLGEAMIEAGVSLGLKQEVAEQLVRKTFSGSGAFAQSFQDKSLETLRQNVTSPGGTTQAALEQLLESQAFATLVDKAVKAAATRSSELSEGN
ncbi:MAG: pyrroline-5-carboxylate reductase [bacterium]|nr:pyrroline-5-carboxylate reductase [bacterium]